MIEVVENPELDTANAEVTRAILYAERQVVGTVEYVTAWRDVEKWEQRIADLTDAGSLQGEIARLGVVSARAKAEATLRSKLKELLGLPDTATDDHILEGVSDLKEKAVIVDRLAEHQRAMESQPPQDDDGASESRRSPAFETHEWVSAYEAEFCFACDIDIKDPRADERCVATLNEEG